LNGDISNDLEGLTDS